MPERARDILSILLEMGRIPQAQYDRAIKYQEQHGGRLAANLVQLGIISHKKLQAILDNEFYQRKIDLNSYPVDPSVIPLLDEENAKKYNTIPIELNGITLVVSMADPENEETINKIEALTGFDVRAYEGKEELIQDKIDYSYTPIRNRKKIQAADRSPTLTIFLLSLVLHIVLLSSLNTFIPEDRLLGNHQPAIQKPDLKKINFTFSKVLPNASPDKNIRVNIGHTILLDDSSELGDNSYLKQALQKLFNANIGNIHERYAKELTRVETFEGQLDIGLKIKGDGTIVTAYIKRNTLPEDRVIFVYDIIQLVKKWDFPPAPGKQYSITLPLTFTK